MEASRVCMHPQGELMVHLKYNRSVLESTNIEDDDYRDYAKDENDYNGFAKNIETMDFQLSLQHVTSASRMAAAMFNMQCLESSKGPDGFFHWTIDPLLHPVAFTTVMRIIHGQTRDLQDPEDVSLDTLVRICVVVDYLFCHDAVSFYAKTCVRFRNWVLPDFFTRNIPKCIFVAQVLEDSKLFAEATCLAIFYSEWSLNGRGYHLDPRVVEAIDKSRGSWMEDIFSKLYDIIRTLKSRNHQCGTECGDMSLGYLMRNLSLTGFYLEELEDRYVGWSVEAILDTISRFKPPVVYLNHMPCTHRGSYDSYDFWHRSCGRASQSPPEFLIKHECKVWGTYFQFAHDQLREYRSLELSNFVDSREKPDAVEFS
ncbi:hypothetical protein CDD82_7106 [Ophiocordyceps australis]|uniref:BTB domain-containing protein n=1 Tax=Ophiocordyceps australis TaxID=1399860 RepID=A0A2C5YTT3_9HYPO|nr:hypothetical protein CDD82_7106 [Ophiocordyceps australis]